VSGSRVDLIGGHDSIVESGWRAVDAIARHAAGVEVEVEVETEDTIDWHLLTKDNLSEYDTSNYFAYVPNYENIFLEAWGKQAKSPESMSRRRVGAGTLARLVRSDRWISPLALDAA
jgi:hypothetical protein